MLHTFKSTPRLTPLYSRERVASAYAELQDASLWNLYRWRTEHVKSPHREVEDIWLRYNDLANLGVAFNDEHESVWYPVATKLPETVNLVNRVVATCGGDRLGGVLVTKVPAGKQVYPHVDGGWHAAYYSKIAVQIAGKPEQRFQFKEEELSTVSGDVYSFDNSYSHWVTNPTSEDRITLIICMRKPQCLGV